MAMGAGMARFSLSPVSASRTSSRWNQRTSAISSSSIEISMVAASAWQPIINDDGKGHGWEEW